MGDNGEGPDGVDSVVGARAVVAGVAHSIGLVGTSLLVTGAFKLALFALALIQARGSAGVRYNAGGGHVAARALALEVWLAVDEGRDEALGIVVPGPVPGAAGVELALASVLDHLGEI